MLDNTRQPDQHQGTGGWYPREMLENLMKIGICERFMFKGGPYRGRPVHLAPEILGNAYYQQIKNYFRVESKNEILSNIRTNGGALLAIPIFEDFIRVRRDWNEPEKLPVVPLPKPGQQPEFYHAVLGMDKVGALGYKILNSHGPAWGRRGYSILPYDYPIMEGWGAVDKYAPPPDILEKDIVLWVDKREYFVGGTQYEMDTEPYNNPYGRAMVPLRFIGQASGFLVKWDEATRSVTLTKGDALVWFKIGSNVFFDNGDMKILTTGEVPEIKNERAHVPLRAIMESQAFGRKVDYFDLERKIVIYKP